VARPRSFLQASSPPSLRPFSPQGMVLNNKVSSPTHGDETQPSASDFFSPCLRPYAHSLSLWLWLLIDGLPVLFRCILSRLSSMSYTLLGEGGLHWLGFPSSMDVFYTLRPRHFSPLVLFLHLVILFGSSLSVFLSFTQISLYFSHISNLASFTISSLLLALALNHLSLVLEKKELVVFAYLLALLST